jgi:hypothetical protein
MRITKLRLAIWGTLVFLAACSDGNPVSPAAPEFRRGSGGRGPAADWVIMTYVPDNGYTVPVPLPVTKAGRGGISFGFLTTPDRSMLLTDKLPKKLLPGYSVSAHIAIRAGQGTTFNYCGANCDGSDPGGFVRFYIQGTNPALIGCESGWHPERPDCEAQYWWSNPVHIDLAELAALGATGTTLTTLLRPETWSDRDGHSGTAVITSNGITVNHMAAFNAAVTNATKAGLSFGGGNNFAFGVGASPLPATFVLHKFDLKK